MPKIPLPALMAGLFVMGWFGHMYDLMVMCAIGLVLYYFGSAIFYAVVFAVAYGAVKMRRVVAGPVSVPAPAPAPVQRAPGALDRVRLAVTAARSRARAVALASPPRPSRAVAPVWRPPGTAQRQDQVREAQREARPEPLAAGVVVTGQVVRVVDGDSLEIFIDSTRQVVPVRLYGIDAPELPSPEGMHSMTVLSNIIYAPGAKPVDVRLQSFGGDRYRRTLAVVYRGDRCLNATLVLSGAARASTYEPIYQNIEAEAKRGHKGIWGMQPSA